MTLITLTLVLTSEHVTNTHTLVAEGENFPELQVRGKSIPWVLEKAPPLLRYLAFRHLGKEMELARPIDIRLVVEKQTRLELREVQRRVDKGIPQGLIFFPPQGGLLFVPVDVDEPWIHELFEKYKTYYHNLGHLVQLPLEHPYH